MNAGRLAFFPAAGAPQKRRAVKLAEDSQVFEAGQLGSAPGGGGLTTYKELCSLATELGQPDLGEPRVRAGGGGRDGGACSRGSPPLDLESLGCTACLPCLGLPRSVPLHGAGQPPGGGEQQPRRRLWVRLQTLSTYSALAVCWHAKPSSPPTSTHHCPQHPPTNILRRFASIAKLAGQQLGPHIQRIIPRLYRFLYDPNGKVRAGYAGCSCLLVPLSS